MTKLAPNTAPKKSAAKPKEKPKSKAKAKVNGHRIADEAKIMWTGGSKDIPFRENSGPWKRVTFVRKMSGRTRAAILAGKVARSSTIRWCCNHGMAKAVVS